MIRRIEFENFMSLKNTRVDLHPLTVFIGPNGSGKSAIFKGLVTLSRLLSGAPLRGPKGEFTPESGVTFDDLVWNGNSGLPIRFRVWLEGDALDQDPGYTLEVGKRQEGWSVVHEKIKTPTGWIEVDANRPFKFPTERRGEQVLEVPLRGTLAYLVHPFAEDTQARPVIEPIIRMQEEFGRAHRYRPSANDIAAFVPQAKPGRTPFVQENGRGVALELQALSQGGAQERETFQRIEKAVAKIFPHVKSLGFKSDWQGVRLTFLTDRSADPIPAPNESDGLLLATFLFWRLYTGGPTMKVCLEEPENGLHAFLLAERFQALKMFAYGGGGLPGLQMLVATHSPEFLRALKNHPMALWKEIRLVEFQPGTGTTVRQLSKFHEVKDIFEAWLNEVHERWDPVVKAWASEKK